MWFLCICFAEQKSSRIFGKRIFLYVIILHHITIVAINLVPVQIWSNRRFEFYHYLYYGSYSGCSSCLLLSLSRTLTRSLYNSLDRIAIAKVALVTAAVCLSYWLKISRRFWNWAELIHLIMVLVLLLKTCFCCSSCVFVLLSRRFICI